MAENLTFKLDVDSSQAVQGINNFFNTFEQGAARAKSTLHKELGQSLQTDIKIEFKNGKLVAKEIQSIKQESSRLGDIWKAVNGRIGRTPNELKKQKQILMQLKGDTQKYANGTKQVTREWQTLTERIRQVDAAQRRLAGGNVLNSFAGRFALIQTAANLATGAILGLVRGFQDLVATAGRMEVLQLQLEAFAGGAEAARETFDQFVEIAANSPLNLEQVASAGKIMMAFGIETDKAVKATEQLAVVSAATGGDINLLARNLGQIAAQGRAYTRDLTQFAIQGIPIWEELSNVTGKSTVALKQMATEGKIGFREVEMALDNMTAKGSKFNEIAERMQETFQGRLARIEAAFQKLALEAVNSFNKLDKAFGGIVSGSMKLFADAIFAIANNFDKITIAVAAATVGTAMFFAVQNWGVIIGFIRTAIAVVQGLANAKKIAAIAAAALQAIMGNWGAIAAGIAAATLTAVALGAAFDSAKDSAAAAVTETDSLTASVGKLGEQEQKNAEWHNMPLAARYSEARQEADKYKKALDEQIEVLEIQKKEIKARFDEEKQGLKDTLSEIKAKIQQEKDALKEAKDAIKEKYDEEKAQLDETLAKIREKYSEEISALQEMGPKQQALYDYEKKKLQEQIKSGELDKEALMKAEARLERMERQEQIAKLRKEQAEAEEPILDRLKEAEDERKTAMEEVTNKYEERIGKLEAEKTSTEAAIKAIEQAYRDEVKAIDEAINAVEKLDSSVQNSTGSVNNQITAVKNLTAQWWAAERAARAAAQQIRAANAARNSGGDGRASGGPVSGGTTYTVNELGKEAFLSASGKLSMINAPAYGQWKAPGRGTVIPAHLTNQLDIPKGGVDLNKTAARNAASVGRSDVSRLASVIASSQRGDNYNNNVTIQAANPVQAANSMMVQLHKIKRSRFR